MWFYFSKSNPGRFICSIALIIKSYIAGLEYLDGIKIHLLSIICKLIEKNKLLDL